MKTNKKDATNTNSVFNRISQDGKTTIGEVVRRSVVENSKKDCLGQKRENNFCEPSGQDAIALLDEFINHNPGEQNASNQVDDNGGVSILDVCDKLSCEYVSFATPIMGDLATLGDKEACRILGKIVGAEVIRLEDKTFHWKEETKYAPRNISFRVLSNFSLRHDENGIVTHPFRLMDARSIMPYLPAELATHGSDEIQFCVGLAKYGHHNAIFTAAESVFMTPGTESILLSMHWGGPRNQVPQTGLRPTEDTCEIIKFSERVSSQRGGEGYDFYIIDIAEITPLREAVGKCLSEQARVINEETRLFAQKYDLFKRFRSAYTGYVDCYADLVNTMWTYLGRVRENECLRENFFVALPEFLLEVPDKIEPTFDFSQDLQELRNLCLRVECITFRSLKAEIEESLEAWEEFAPKYAKLYNPVVKICHGRILIKGDKAIITIISRGELEDTFEKPKKIEFEYAFNEVELGHCLGMLNDRVAKEQEAKAKNQELMEKLLAE